MSSPTVERLPGGIWSIPVPIPHNPLGYTLVYLLEGDGGPVLVDAGWDDPASRAALEAGLATAGTSIREIEGVLVTHHHPDHHGLAGDVREASGCWIAMHELDAEVVRDHRAVLLDEDVRDEHWARWSATLRRDGVPEQDITSLEELMVPTTRPPAMPDRTIVDRQVITLADRDVEARWMPGHSPGHTCFWLPGSRQLLSGDHVLPNITPHVGVYEDGDEDLDPLGRFLTSLDDVAAMDPAEILPAHLHRFDGGATRAKEIQAHHHERLDDLLRRLSDDGPTTLFELARGMTWHRAWEDIPRPMRRVALSEARAHVQHLQHRGEITATGTDVARYELTDLGRQRL